MAKHISSIDYKYIPIEYVIKMKKLENIVRDQKKKLKEYRKELLELRNIIKENKNESEIYKNKNNNIR